MFLPISSTPQPERRQTPQRRHSIEKETPTNVRQFQPPSKHSSKSLVRVCRVFSVESILHQMGWTKLHASAIISNLTTQEDKLWVQFPSLDPYWVEYTSSTGLCPGSLVPSSLPSKRNAPFSLEVNYAHDILITIFERVYVFTLALFSLPEFRFCSILQWWKRSESLMILFLAPIW